MANRGGNKCVPEGTMIYDPIVGESVAIEKFVAEQRSWVSSVSSTGEITNGCVVDWIDTGRQPCVEFKFASGRTVEVTPDHPFLGGEGWRPANEFSEGDKIASPSVLHSDQVVILPDEHIDLLAVLLSEGNYTQDTVRFTTTDDELLSIGTAAANTIGCDVRRLRGPQGIDFGVVKRSGLRNPARIMLDLYSCGRKKAPQKEIPKEIFQTSNEQISRFLSVFWMCDGFVTPKDIGCNLASEKMVRQLQHLLLRLGIQSRVSKTGPNAHGVWIYSSSYEEFQRQISLWGYKKEQLAILCAKKRNPNAGPLDGDLWWDQIRSIIPVGDKQTYDLTVLFHHNFVANDMLVHNTHGVAILHLLNLLYKPGIEACTVGAIEAQADRAYNHFRTLVRIYQEKTGQDVVLNSMQKLTRMKNQSTLEILAGTKNAVNGPHPQVVHVDEVELMDPEVYQESRNMSQGKTRGDRHFRAQDIITSTRKRGVGPMQELIDQINEAKLMDMDPPYTMYAWCIFECAQAMDGSSETQKKCQITFPDAPEEEKCGCDRIASGRWDNEQPRTLKDVCGGRFGKSDGWIDHDTIVNVFTKSSRGIWEAQQECIRPSTEGLVYPQFNVDRHGIRKYVPDPENGPIYMGMDFGGTNPFGIVWLQRLNFEVETISSTGVPIRMKEGSVVIFDEVYKADIGNQQAAALIIRKENYWRSVVPYFKVNSRFADPQGKAARLDFARHNPPLPTKFLVSRDVKEHIKVCAYYIENDRVFVDVDRCEMFVSEIESYHYPKKKAGMVDDPDIPVKDFDHTVDAFRYALVNIDKMHLGSGRSKKLPSATGKQHLTVQGAGSRRQTEIPAYAPNNRDLPQSEQWRLRFGGQFR